MSQAAILADPTALSADKLARMTGEGVRELVGWKRGLPLQEERACLLREVGYVPRNVCNGRAAAATPSPSWLTRALGWNRRHTAAWRALLRSL